MKNNLKAVRESKGITQRQLAKMTGLATATICYLDKNKRFFSRDSLQKIAAALGCKEEDLLAEAGEAANSVASKNDKNIHESSQALNPVLFRYTLEILDELTKGRNLSSDQKIELATGIYSKVEEYERAEGVDKSKLLSQAKISLMIDEGLVNFLSKKEQNEIQNLKIANEPSAKKENCSDDGVGTPRAIAK